MPDLIPSEATTAGAIRQSVDGTKRCPRCGSKLDGRNPYLPSYGRYECGSYERDDTATIECYRRQLAQAQAEVERLRREREIVRNRLRSARMHIPTSTPSPPDGKAAMKIGAKDPILAYKITNDCIELLEGPKRCEA